MCLNKKMSVAALASAADDSRAIVNILCKRILKPDFNSGALMVCPDSSSSLASIYDNPEMNFISRMIDPQEWEDALFRVQSWRDESELRGSSSNSGKNKSKKRMLSSKDAMSAILEKHSKFPTIEKAVALLGEDRANEYRNALEMIENDSSAYSRFPDEKISSGWNRHTCERAVSLVVDVIGPNIESDDPNDMTLAYGRYTRESRVRTREKAVANTGDRNLKKTAAKALGIWFPFPSDMDKWKLDDRTRRRYAEFSDVVTRATDKMRIMRTVLQFIPKRKLCNATVADLDANIERIKNYLG